MRVEKRQDSGLGLQVAPVISGRQSGVRAFLSLPSRTLLRHLVCKSRLGVKDWLRWCPGAGSEGLSSGEWVCNCKVGGQGIHGSRGGCRKGTTLEGCFLHYCLGQLGKGKQGAQPSHADVQAPVRVSQRSHRKFRETPWDGSQRSSSVQG